MADDRDRRDVPDDFERREEPSRRNAAAGGWTWWWIWLAILIFIIWFGGWGWGPYGGWWGWGAPRNVQVRPGPAGATAAKNSSQNANTPANETSNASGTVAVLTSPAKSSYVGKQVHLDRVKVQGTSGKNVMWVGPSDSQKLLVVEKDGNQNNRVRPPANSVVDVSGTVEKAPDAAQAEEQWGLSSDDAQKLEKDGVYISANKVQPLQPR